MKNIRRNRFRYLLLSVASLSCALLAGCLDDINNYEKTTPAEASNKVFISEKYATLPFTTYRTVGGTVANMDTLVTKMVVNCTSPAGGDLTVRVIVDSLLIDVYNTKHESARKKIQGNWIRLDKSTLKIKEGATESDTLTIALTRPLANFLMGDGYIMPIRLNSVTGYDAQLDFSKRVSYFMLDVTQENGVGFEEGKNGVAVDAKAGFDGYDIPIVAFMASESDVRIGLEVDNSLVATFNAEYGTDFKTLTNLELPSEVTLSAGNTTCPVRLSYTGNSASLANANYLIPVKIKSVASTGADPMKLMSTDTYYLIVNAFYGWSIADDDSALGIKQTERSAYKAIGSADTEFKAGSWESMFKGQQWVTQDYPRSVTVDLGSEARQITGLYIQAANAQMPPVSINISYSGEKLYADYPFAHINLGTVELPRKKDLYLSFDKPVDARYIGLNNMAGVKNGAYSFVQFNIYTKE